MLSPSLFRAGRLSLARIQFSRNFSASEDFEVVVVGGGHAGDGLNIFCFKEASLILYLTYNKIQNSIFLMLHQL